MKQHTPTQSPIATTSGTPLWTRSQATLYGGAAGLAAAAAGGPLTVITFAIPQLNSSGEIGPATLGIIATAALSAVFAMVIAGIPAAALGAMLGNWIYDKPLDLNRVVVILLAGNVLTMASAVGLDLGFADSTNSRVIGSLVVSTLATLVAIEVFKRLRRRIGRIA